MYVRIITFDFSLKYFIFLAGNCSRYDFFSFFSKIKMLKNVSCQYDRWAVETQLCKLRDTSDTLVGRACI